METRFYHAMAQRGRQWFVVDWMIGIAVGGYFWQFLETNLDFTGPMPIDLTAGLIITLLIGPLLVSVTHVLSALTLVWLSGLSLRECLHRDTLSQLPLAFLGLSPLAGLLIDFHSTAYHAGVVVLVSVSFSMCLSFKAVTAWSILQESSKHPCLSERAGRTIVAAVCCAFALLFSVLQVLRYNAYQLWGVDHSMVTQAVWNTLHGRFLTFTFVYGIDLTLVADHFEPIFALLVPFYAIWPDPRLPLIIQAVFVSLAAFPVYSIALQQLKSPALALGWALAYLLLPMTISAAQDSGGTIRSSTMAIAIFMFMLDALARKKWRIFALTVVLGFAAKEYLSLLVAMLGLYMAITQRRRALGLSLFTAGMLWFVALVQWILPALRTGPNLTLAARFGSSVGEAGLAGMIPLVLHDPSQLLAMLFSYDRSLFSFFLFLSLGGLSLLDPLLTAVSLPIFVIFGLISYNLPGAVDLGDMHYYPLIPILLVAAINGTASLTQWTNRHIKVISRRTAVALTVFALGMSLTAGFFWSSGPWSWKFWDRRIQLHYFGNKYMADERVRVADDFVGRVPQEVPVLASDYLLTRLSHRSRVYHFFRPPDDVLERVDYAIVNLFENHLGRLNARDGAMALVGDLLNDPRFTLTAYEDGLLFFQRGTAGGYISQIERLTENPQPQVWTQQNLGNRLRLLGYDPPTCPLRAAERYQVTYYWQVLDGFADPFEVVLGINPEGVEIHSTDYVVADRFAGPAGEFNVLHLPTYAQMPPEDWEAGQIIKETYDFRLPVDAQGQYEWSVGIYAVPRIVAIRISNERQIPGSEPIELDILRVQP